MEKRIYTGFAIALIIMLIIGIASYMSINELVETNREAYREVTEAIKMNDRDAAFVEKHIKRAYADAAKATSIIFLGSIFAIVSVSSAIVIIHRDITERRRYQRALNENLHFMQILIDSIPAPIFYKNTEGKYLGCNRTFEECVGLTKEEIIGKTVYDAAPGELADIYHEKDEELFKTRNIQVYETSFRYADGSLHNVMVHKSPFSRINGTVEGLVGVMTDITQIRRMEDELLKAKKLESIGVLAGGMAHDFNNLLTVIMGNIFLAKLQTKLPDNILEELAEAEEACIRAKALTHHLLVFAKGEEPHRQRVSIYQLIKDSADFLFRGSTVGYKLFISENLRAAEADAGQISQAIHNILLNAKEAMSHGGIVGIRAENVNICSEDGIPLKEGKYIKISIEDQGVGIPQEHLQRIFDPYFTTKEMSSIKGTGLGLAVAYSIIKNHDGYIGVESEVGAGTTFHIYLPAYTEEFASTQISGDKGGRS
ncbi:MAG: PAS domain S-box protein [Nitrospiraceae bacterium]|nr:PAS domain S-box protein [Nitrospirota bacterium]MDA8337676.1 PAS domain S-box protein [Nitrospiraceae bacterium]